MRETVRVCSVYAPKTVPTSSQEGTTLTKHFRDRLPMGVFCVQSTTGRAAVLHMVDTATRFGASRVLKEERGADVNRAFERAWIRIYEPPKHLQFDEAGCVCSHEVTVFLSTLWSSTRRDLC